MPRARASRRTEVERRGSPRRLQPGVVVSAPTGEVALVDASRGGLGIRTSGELRVGVLYPFRLHRGRRVVEVYGIARWCVAAGRSGYRAGLTLARTDSPLTRLWNGG